MFIRDSRLESPPYLNQHIENRSNSYFGAMADTRRDEILGAIKESNTPLNQDVRAIIAGFTRDLEVADASIQCIKCTNSESMVWQELGEHLIYPKSV